MAQSHCLPLGAIGRVLVMPEYRGKGLARQIMTQAIKYCQKNYRKTPIIISAQTYLIHFYESLGFAVDGEPYLEDGIEHITMILDPKRKAKGKALGLPSVTTANILYAILLLLVALFIIGLLYLMI